MKINRNSQTYGMFVYYIKTLWSSYYDITSIDFNSKKIHKDKILDQRDILQFFSGVSIQRLQICEIPKHEIQLNLSIISQATKITGPNYKNFPILHLSTPAAITVCGSDLLKLYHFL